MSLYENLIENNIWHFTERRASLNVEGAKRRGGMRDIFYIINKRERGSFSTNVCETSSLTLPLYIWEWKQDNTKQITKVLKKFLVFLKTFSRERMRIVRDSEKIRKFLDFTWFVLFNRIKSKICLVLLNCQDVIMRRALTI